MRSIGLCESHSVTAKALDSLRVQVSQVASSEAAMRRPQALSVELRTGLVVKDYVAGKIADVPRNMRN
jgi:hypothetical protein